MRILISSVLWLFSLHLSQTNCERAKVGLHIVGKVSEIPFGGAMKMVVQRVPNKYFKTKAKQNKKAWKWNETESLVL